MVRFGLAHAVLVVLAAMACSPKARPVLSEQVVEEHRLFDLDPVRTDRTCSTTAEPGPPGWAERLVQVSLRVDRAGRPQVRGIAIAGGEGQVAGHCAAQIRNAARNWRYQPFGASDRPDVVEFVEEVRVFPPEIWREPRAPFPELVDLASARVVLERHGCYGFCPAYRVELRGDGTSTFEGYSYVREIGERSGAVDLEEFSALIEQFRAADFLSLRESYRAEITDHAAYFITLDMNGQRTTVEDYFGEMVGMPTAVVRLERAIDRVARTEQWIGTEAERSRHGY
jgi:hypothetical protein